MKELPEVLDGFIKNSIFPLLEGLGLSNDSVEAVELSPRQVKVTIFARNPDTGHLIMDNGEPRRTVKTWPLTRPWVSVKSDVEDSKENES